MAKTFNVKLVKSYIGATKTQRATLKAMGLSKIGSEKVLADNPANRGQIFKMQHLLQVTTGKASK